MRKSEAANLRRGDKVRVFVENAFGRGYDGWLDGVVSKGAFYGSMNTIDVNVRTEVGLIKNVPHTAVRWSRR